MSVSSVEHHAHETRLAARKDEGNEYIHKVRNSNRNRNWLLALGISCAAHLPACGVVYNGHHFGGGLFVYLLAKGACLHVAVGLNNVHRAVAAKGERKSERKEKGFYWLFVFFCYSSLHSLGMIIVDSVAHKCMPVSRTLEPGGKIAALSRRRFTEQHYTRADLQKRETAVK